MSNKFFINSQFDAVLDSKEVGDRSIPLSQCYYVNSFSKRGTDRLFALSLRFYEYEGARQASAPHGWRMIWTEDFPPYTEVVKTGEGRFGAKNRFHSLAYTEIPTYELGDSRIDPTR